MRTSPKILLLAVLFLLSAAPGRSRTIDRDPVPGTLTRRFSVPVIGAVLGSADGRSYALASDRIADGGTMPRSLWWTRAPGESRWTLLKGIASPFYPRILAPDPVRPGLVYAADASTGQILRSQDAGATWETRGAAPGGNVQQLLAVGTDLLLMGEYPFCLPCLSHDGGRSWEQPATQVSAVLVSAGDPSIVYAFSEIAILRSPDAGRSFVDVSPGPSEGASALAVAPSDPGVVYALAPDSAAGFLSRTTDGGASWQRLAAPQTGLTWSGPAVDPAAASHVVVLGGPADASAPRRLFESLDGGLTWTPRAAAVDATTLRFSGTSIEAFGHRGLFTSAGPGAPWTPADRGISADSRLLLAGTPGGDLYVTAQETGGVFHSADAGGAWEARGSRPGLQSLAVDPFDSQRVVGIDGTSASLSWSDDGGRTWVSRPGPAGTAELALPQQPGVRSAPEGHRLRLHHRRCVAVPGPRRHLEPLHGLAARRDRLHDLQLFQDPRRGVDHAGPLRAGPLLRAGAHL